MKKNFNLALEMNDALDVIKNFKVNGKAREDGLGHQTKNLNQILKNIKKTNNLFLAGEGSSRIFPANNIISICRKKFPEFNIRTEGCREATEFDLKKFTLLGTSNSGKTKELISLFRKKKASSQFSMSAYSKSPLYPLSNDYFVLNCGKENAVAATKSSVEQALFFQNLVFNYFNKKITKKTLLALSKKCKQALDIKIDKNIINKLSKVKTLYFAGRNDGVAEEIALKTNEIIKKKSIYLKGTYLLHGIEETMNKNEAIIIIEPFKEDEKKIKEIFINNIGMSVIAISSRKTIFPTIKISKLSDFNSYIQLFACWNLLYKIGITLKINIDETKRARKIGNEE